MAKEIILIGGGDYRRNENIAIDNYIVSKIDDSSRISIIPFAVKEKEKQVSRFNSIKEVFLKKGKFKLCI